MTLLESIVRLAFVIALLVWLPGWLSSRGALRPLSLLHAGVVGLGIHFGILVAATSVSQRLESVIAFVLWGTAGVVLIMAVSRIRFRRGEREGYRATIQGVSVVAVVLCVAVAALLRWFHNYHFDDFQHLVYLTEINRQDDVFPRQFMLHVDLWASTDRALVVSRYPFWAAEYVVLSKIAGVPLGDGYYVIGLGLLVLTFGLIAALCGEVLTSRWGGAFGLVTLLAGGQILTRDALLNFGGYPFQAGKLFILIGALACLAYWRSRKPVQLLYVAIAFFIAPLLHTNNILGSLSLLAVIASAAVLSAPARRVLAVAALSTLLVIGVGLIAVATDGFIRFVSRASELATSRARALHKPLELLPDNAAARVHSGDGALPRLLSRIQHYNIFEHQGAYYGVPQGLAFDPSVFRDGNDAVIRGRSDEEVAQGIRNILETRSTIDELAVGAPGNVGGRRMLFIRRALPLELLPVVMLLGAYFRSSKGSFHRWVVPATFVVCVTVILMSSMKALARQVAATAIKPGYLNMRASLVGIPEAVRVDEVFTDPTTQVYLNAAGWSIPDPPQFTLHEQFGRLLMFHPTMSGPALQYLWAREQRPLLVVNEAVVGPDVAMKFDGMKGVDHVFRSGSALPTGATLIRTATHLVEQLYSLDYASGMGEAVSGVRTLWDVLFRRPLYVFSSTRIAPPEEASFADALQSAMDAGGLGRPAAGAVEQRAHLSTVLLRASVPRGCFASVRMDLEGTGSFGSTVLIHVLPMGRAAGHWTTTAVVTPNQPMTTLVPFWELVCGPGDLAIFVHSNYMYDLRFRVTGIAWTQVGANQRQER